MNHENQKTIQAIEKRYYFNAIKAQLQKRIKEFGEVESLNYLTEIMQYSKDDVEIILQKRVKKGEIKDANQAERVSREMVFRDWLLILS